ncbi:MAG: signal peptidase II [Proteobacteria bacterium]|nr:signal peptidase II [Pseudomonadota bacterium]
MSKPGLKWLWLIFILFILDQASKWWVLAHVKTGEFVQLIPSFNLTMAHNSGIAFSLFSQKSSWGQVALILFIILICSFIAGMLLNTKLQEKWNGISLSLILGGALGNLCDRIWHGYVIDFIDFYVNNWHWYTFNLADAFITVGAIMMTKTILFPKE